MTLERAQVTLTGVDGALNQDSPLGYELLRTLRGGQGAVTVAGLAGRLSGAEPRCGDPRRPAPCGQGGPLMRFHTRAPRRVVLDRRRARPGRLYGVTDPTRYYLLSLEPRDTSGRFAHCHLERWRRRRTSVDPGLSRPRADGHAQTPTTRSRSRPTTGGRSRWRAVSRKHSPTISPRSSGASGSRCSCGAAASPV